MTCEVSSLYVKLKISYRGEIVKSLKSKFDLLTQNQKRSPSCDCQHMCEVSAMYATRKWNQNLTKWSYANGKKFEVNLTMTFDLLTPNSIDVLHGSRSTHVWSTIIVSQNEMELSCRNGKKFEVQIRLWPLTPKSLEVLLWVMVNTCVKYLYCKSKGEGVIVQKPLFHRRKPDSHGETSEPTRTILIRHCLEGG